MNKREWMLQAALMWIRAGHGGTADGAAAALSGTYDAICAASPETPQEGAWVEHDGDVSKAPQDHTAIEVQFRNGTTCGTNSNNVAWDHVDSVTDVMWWRYA